jgi:hypothetical protein
MAGREVEDIDQRRIFVHGVVKVSDLTAAGLCVRGADQLPKIVIGIVSYQQNGLTKLEDFDGLDAAGPGLPAPMPTESRAM